MKITGIKLYPLTLRFKQVFEESFGTVGKVEKNVLIQIFTDEGIYGLGEAISLGPWYSVETQGSIMFLIKEYIGPKVLLGEDPFNVDKIWNGMDNVSTNNTVAKSCVDFALYDIMGKALGVPVYKLIGGKFADRIPMRWGIGNGSPEQMVEFALEGIDKGFRGLKIKCGIDVRKDIEIVKTLRKAIGDDVDLTVDVNQAYTPEQAIRLIKQMEEYNVLCVEQPVLAFDLDGLRRVRDNTTASIGLCEAGLTSYEIMKAIKKEAVDYVHLKIARSGGFYRGKQIVGMIRAANMSCTGSTQLGMGVELAADAHFAVATKQLGNPPYHIQGYGSGLMKLFNVSETTNITDDIVTKTPIIKDGYMYVPEDPGLGVEINPAGVEKYMEESPVVIGDCGASK
ncbi:MAG: mandelate racemase/muconate lactonizing enzyme family protein [Clostridiales Family XIII bacterium]|nr:mandelate racemase/muconate lactonizing enzyme family protein [Clostridiales Family XIII bacterium]